MRQSRLERDLRAALADVFTEPILAGVRSAIVDHHHRVNLRARLKARNAKMLSAVDDAIAALSRADRERQKRDRNFLGRPFHEYILDLRQAKRRTLKWLGDEQLITRLGAPTTFARHKFLVDIGHVLIGEEISLGASHSWSIGNFARVASAALRAARIKRPDSDPHKILAAAKHDAENVIQLSTFGQVSNHQRLRYLRAQ